MGVSEKPQKNSRVLRADWSISMTPFRFDDDISEREDTFRTNGLFFVTYGLLFKNSSKPFLIRGDAYDMVGPFRVYDWKGFVMMSSESAVLSFLLKYTNVSEELFRIAKENPGVQVPFCLDVVRYCKDLGSHTLYTHAQVGQVVEYCKKKRANEQLVYNRAMNDLDLLTGKKEES